jgi:hypothetical protein
MEVEFGVVGSGKVDRNCVVNVFLSDFVLMRGDSLTKGSLCLAYINGE